MAEIYPQGSQEFYPYDELSDGNNTPYPVGNEDTAWLFDPRNPDYMSDVHRDNDDYNTFQSPN
jgi:hypothetical protein